MYLGAAPGVGKTHAMLEEGVRRASRGADVVVGVLDDTGRLGISALAAGLPHESTIAGRDGEHHGMRAILNPEYAIISTPTAPIKPDHHEQSKRTEKRASRH